MNSQDQTHLFKREQEGERAGIAALARGLDPKAMIKGAFTPARGFEFASDAPGTFEVKRGSLIVSEVKLSHSDALAWWRGYVSALENAESRA
jgi:hypothetical protein